MSDDALPEHWLETVERYEEDLTDTSRPHPPLHVVIMVGAAIPCDPAEDRRRATARITARMHEGMEALRVESLRYRRHQP